MSEQHSEQEKSKEELLELLTAARNENAKLRKELELVSPKKNEEQPVEPRAPRFSINTPIEFIGDFDILEAEGVNLSDSGICFEVPQPLCFEMQFRVNDKMHSHRAQLIWVRQEENGHSRLGLEFVPYREDPLFRKVGE